MSVVIETTLGDITVDLFLQQRPVTCLNFLKLCKMKYYNFNLFHSIRSGFIAQTGDPTGEGTNGESIFGVLEGHEKRFFSGEKLPKIRHTNTGTLSMVCTGDMMVGSQFFFTLAPDLDSLDSMHCVIGEVTEGHDVLRKLNDVICDDKHRPYRDVRITHTVILEDPFNDPPGFHTPSRSPSPSAERLKGGRIAPDEDIDETQGKSAAEIQEIIEEKEAKARATILEIVGDLPDADIAPPENVLFVCKLNPVTTDEDLEIIFSRFGTIVGCEVIRDKKTGDSLQYAFVEFSDKKSCEEAYFKMDNVLIDDRRIHVDFSQSVSKMRYLGKGRGVQYFNDDNDSNFQGKSDKDINRNNNGDYKNGKTDKEQENKDYDKNGDKSSRHKRSRSRDKDKKRSRRERSRSRRDRSKSRRDRSRSKRDRSRSRRNRSRSRSKRTSKSSRHRKDRSSSRRRDRSRDRRRDRKSSPKRSRSGRKSSRDRRLRSPRSYSRARTDRSHNSRRSKRDSDRKSRRDKSYEKKARDKSTSRSRSKSRTRTRKSSDVKEIPLKPDIPQEPQDQQKTEEKTDNLGEVTIIPSRSRSKSQNKIQLNDQISVVNVITEPRIPIKPQEIVLEKKIVSNDRKSDLKANYSTYWRKSKHESYPPQKLDTLVMNAQIYAKHMLEKQKMSRWERSQEPNFQDEILTTNAIQMQETNQWQSLNYATLENYQQVEISHDVTNWVTPQAPNSQIEPSLDNNTETSKWRKLEDVSTQQLTDRALSKSRSRSPVKREEEQIEDKKVEVCELDISHQEIAQEKHKSRSRSKSPASRLEQEPKSQNYRKKEISQSHSNTDEEKTTSKPEYIENEKNCLSQENSADIVISPLNDNIINRSRSKSHDKTDKKRDKSLEPTPEIEPGKLAKKDDNKISHKDKKLKHHKETKVSHKSVKKHKKNKDSSILTKKRNKTSKADKRGKKVAKKRKRKHSTSSSSESSDSSSSESSSSSEDERKKRKRKKKKVATSSSSESSTSSSSDSSSTSTSSSDSEPSKKKRKKVKSSKKGKKKQ